METVVTVALTLMAVLVGMIVVVMLQLHHALRQLSAEVRDARQRIEPVFEKLNSSSHLATGVAMAVAAGVRAYRESKHEAEDEARASRVRSRDCSTERHEEAFI